MNRTIRRLRAQSAMEYLMTYGWAILVIAVVLSALFSLGLFTSGSSLSTFCQPFSGYQCKSITLHSGTLSATVGQGTGSTWTVANVLLVESGAPAPSLANFALTGCSGQSTGGLASGQTYSLSVTSGLTSSSACTALTSTVAQSVSGTIWACYDLTSTTACSQIIEIATFNAKAT